jgi:hypothetical protein
VKITEENLKNGIGIDIAYLNLGEWLVCTRQPAVNNLMRPLGAGDNHEGNAGND